MVGRRRVAAGVDSDLNMGPRPGGAVHDSLLALAGATGDDVAYVRAVYYPLNMPLENATFASQPRKLRLRDMIEHMVLGRF